MIEPANTIALKDALRDDTVFFFTESPTNPYLRVIDVPEAARIAHERGVKVIIDSTFASPVNHRAARGRRGSRDPQRDEVSRRAQRPDRGRGARAARSRSSRSATRSACSAASSTRARAYLLLRGMKTLALRMERHNENGLAVARFLEAHPKVRRVWYPGLPSHPDYAVATRADEGLRAASSPSRSRAISTPRSASPTRAGSRTSRRASAASSRWSRCRC